MDQFSGIQHPVSVCPGVTELEDKLGRGNVVDDLGSGDSTPPPPQGSADLVEIRRVAGADPRVKDLPGQGDPTGGLGGRSVRTWTRWSGRPERREREDSGAWPSGS